MQRDGPAHRFQIHLDRPNTLTLPWTDSESLLHDLEEFIVRGQYPRIFFFTTRLEVNEQEPLLEAFKRHHYREERRWASTIKTTLFLFQRTE